jgi:16S rRNA (cytosine967-C5)-methyltransferase
LVAHLLDPQPGEHVLDACAGAGGKTLHSAALMENRGKIIASDINSFKLKQLITEARRLGVTIVETASPNRSKNTPDEMFDRVLVDAPCSGLGTLRRNPEIRWRMQADEIDALRLKQLELLKNAALQVRPGGRLAYCVCTTTPEETSAVASDFLKADSRFAVVIPGNLPPELITADGFLQTFSHRHSLDGFFGALFVRKS